MSSFRATEVEFRQRFWFIFVIFFAAYGLYYVDSEAACLRLARLFAPEHTPAFTLGLRLVFAAGAVLVAAGGLLRAWGTAYLGAGVMRDRNLHAEKLTADGPFRFVRNPLYIGNILLALGLGVTASVPGWIVLVVLMTLFVLRLILREEAELSAAQGEAYDAYRRRVPRLIPALRPRLPASGARPVWGPAIAAEFMMWVFAAGLLVLAATLNAKVFWILILVGLIGGSAIMGTRKRLKKRSAGGNAPSTSDRPSSS
jgi:protein-S-isoprenylcysteine O-methyltransferase Ste14